MWPWLADCKLQSARLATPQSAGLRVVFTPDSQQASRDVPALAAAAQSSPAASTIGAPWRYRVRDKSMKSSARKLGGQV
jgi:hypothetical protein